MMYAVMARLLFNLVMLIIMVCLALSYYSVHGLSEAHPSSFGSDSDSDSGICNVAADTSLPPPRRTSRIVDITHAYREDLPVGDSSQGLGNPIKLIASMKNGSLYNFSEMKMIVHTGTHVDSPAHFYQEHYEAGLDVDTLDLELLNGPALLVDVPRDTNITAKVMEALHIPRGVQRVLFRTLNTDRRLMWKREFDSSFVGFMEDGAQWLVENTDIKLVGIDYLSAAAYDHLTQSHRVFLANKLREDILVNRTTEDPSRDDEDKETIEHRKKQPQRRVEDPQSKQKTQSK